MKMMWNWSRSFRSRYQQKASECSRDQKYTTTNQLKHWLVPLSLRRDRIPWLQSPCSEAEVFCASLCFLIHVKQQIPMPFYSSQQPSTFSSLFSIHCKIVFCFFFPTVFKQWAFLIKHTVLRLPVLLQALSFLKKLLFCLTLVAVSNSFISQW